MHNKTAVSLLKLNTTQIQKDCISFPEPVFVNLLRSPGIDAQPGGPVRQPYLTYWPARLHRLAESIPGIDSTGFLNFYNYEFWLCA